MTVSRQGSVIRTVGAGTEVWMHEDTPIDWFCSPQCMEHMILFYVGSSIYDQS